MFFFHFKQPRWKTIEYSKREINNAGNIIRNNNSTENQIQNAIKIIDNWRAAHAYPLHIIYSNLRNKFGKKDGVIVAERLKRLSSITNKLKIEEGMNLWRMQDLGGCRVIVPTIKDVYEYSEAYKTSRIRHIFVRETDYIKDPKVSGYRSLHLIYKFHSDKKETYNRNMLIEIQFRTRLQHLWATAVETMGLFTKQAIKSGQGSAEIKRFFILVSSLFAIKENCPIIPNTIPDIDELISEIELINSEHNFLDFLSGIRVAVNYQQEINRPGYYILILNYNTKRLNVKYFKPSQIEEANSVYSSIERNRSESKIDAVLVRVTSFQTLRAAYPNYFSDIGEFVEIVSKYLKN